jgi:SAM-dependent methyltransferase
VLAGWAASVNWDRILRAWAAIHSRTPQTWTLDCKRYGPHGCAARRIDKLALQQRLRAALHTSLPQLHHEPTAPDLLIVFNVSGSLTVAGIPILSQRPDRPTILHKGLHHSICWGLGAAARLQMGDVVDPSQLALARDNVEGVDTVRTPKQRQRWAKGTPAQKAAAPRPTPNISLLRADARDLPVRSGSVDAVLCDLPFGRQHGSPEGNVALYPAVLSEVMRVLRPAGRAVLLTDDASSRVLIAAVGGSGLQLYRAVPFEYCALHCVLHLIQKPAPGSADPGPGFDDDLLARLEGGAWADCKPRMDWYRPRPGRPD